MITQEKKWSLPDWVPADVGDVLVRDEDWCLIKDYHMDTREPIATAIHVCGGGKWVPRNHPPQLINGKCDTCGSVPPEAFLGFAALAQWQR